MSAEHPCTVCEGGEEVPYNCGDSAPAYGPCFVCEPDAVRAWLEEAESQGFEEQVEIVREDIAGWREELRDDDGLRVSGPAAC